MTDKSNNHPYSEELLDHQIRFFRTGGLLFLGLIAWGITSVCSEFAEIISVIGYAVLISYLLIGAVDWVQEKTIIKRRGLIVFLLYSLIILVLGLFCLFVLPKVAEQIGQLAKQVPYFFTRTEEWISQFNSNNPNLPKIDLNLVSTEITRTLNNTSREAVSALFSWAFNTINFAIYFLVTIVLSVYGLIDGPRIWWGLLRPLSDAHRVHADNLRYDLGRCLRGYFVGQMQLSALSGLFVFVMYLLMGSKYALLLGIWQAIVEIIPVLGGFLGISLGVLLLIFVSPVKALIAFVLYMFYTQVIKDNFLAPRIMGNAINLHPVVVLIVVLIGAQAAGVSGVVFSLPLAGIANAGLNYYLKLRNTKDSISHT